MENWVQVHFHSENTISIFTMVILRSITADLHNLVQSVFLRYQQLKSTWGIPYNGGARFQVGFLQVGLTVMLSNVLQILFSPRSSLLTNSSGTCCPLHYFTDFPFGRHRHISEKRHLMHFKVTGYCLHILLKCTQFLQIHKFWKKLWSIWTH